MWPFISLIECKIENMININNNAKCRKGKNPSRSELCKFLKNTSYGTLHAPIVQWLGYLPSKQVTRVRVPVGAA